MEPSSGAPPSGEKQDQNAGQPTTAPATETNKEEGKDSALPEAAHQQPATAAGPQHTDEDAAVPATAAAQAAHPAGEATAHSGGVDGAASEAKPLLQQPVKKEDELPVGAALGSQAAAATTPAPAAGAQSSAGDATGPVGMQVDSQGGTGDAAKADASRPGKRSPAPVDNAEAKEAHRLKRRLGYAVTAVEHMEYLVAQLQHSQAFQATQRVKAQEQVLGPTEKKMLTDAHERRVSDIITKQCSNVLKSLQGHKWGWPFNQPVDTNQFSDYLKMVKNPMDLGTIRQRIDSGFYKDPEAFAADTRLVFSNARLYNPPGTDVHVMALTLKGKFEERWQSVVMPKIADEMNTCRTEEVAAERRMLETKRAREVELYEHRSMQLLSQIDALEAGLAEDKAAAAYLCQQHMGREARQQLQQQLEALDDDAFLEVLSVILNRYPGLVGTDGRGGVELDLESLDVLTLRLAQIAADQACQKGESWKEGSSAGSFSAQGTHQLVGSGIRGFRPPRSIRLAHQAMKAAGSQERAKNEETGGQPPSGVQAGSLQKVNKAAEQSSNAIDAMATAPAEVGQEEAEEKEVEQQDMADQVVDEGAVRTDHEDVKADGGAGEQLSGNRDCSVCSGEPAGHGAGESAQPAPTREAAIPPS